MPNAITSVELFCLKCGRRRGGLGCEWVDWGPDEGLHLWDLLPPGDPDHRDRLPEAYIHSVWANADRVGARPRLLPGWRGDWNAPFVVEVHPPQRADGPPSTRYYVFEHDK
jgi:hypothetical protein